jgi:hypothetical protein
MATRRPFLFADKDYFIYYRSVANFIKIVNEIPGIFWSVPLNDEGALFWSAPSLFVLP